MGGEGELRQTLAEPGFERGGERRTVKRSSLPRRHPLDGTALHEEPLDGVERSQLVMPRLQRSDLRRDGEEIADEILKMRREIDDELGLGFGLERAGIAPRGEQPVVQLDIAGGEMRDEQRVDAREAIAAVEIVELQTVLEGERHRWRLKILQGVGGRVLSAKRHSLTIYRIVRVHTNRVVGASARPDCSC